MTTAATITPKGHAYWSAIEHGERRMDDDDIRLVDTIRQAIRAGVYYADDLCVYVGDAYGISPNDPGWTSDRVKSGDFGMEIYRAHRELSRIEALAADVTAAQGIQPGDVFKGVTMAHHKFSTVIVESVDGPEVVCTAKKRGTRNTWQGTMRASALAT